jgi:hypothetical protein
MRQGLFFIVFSLTALPGYAQVSMADTSFLNNARTYVLKRYEKDINGQSRINNGSQYKDYFSRNDEHPYFGIDDWVDGDISYDDEVYRNVPMFYDISKDKVISEHALNGSKLELINEKIKWFSLDEHRFRRIFENESDVISPGFVEILYDGTTKVYARREKHLDEKVEPTGVIASFDERTRLYIKKGDTYYAVRKKKSVLDVFEDKKSELKTFLNKRKVTFNKDRENAIIQMAEFYDAQK